MWSNASILFSTRTRADQKWNFNFNSCYVIAHNAWKHQKMCRAKVFAIAMTKSNGKKIIACLYSIKLKSELKEWNERERERGGGGGVEEKSKWQWDNSGSSKTVSAIIIIKMHGRKRNDDVPHLFAHSVGNIWVFTFSARRLPRPINIHLKIITLMHYYALHGYVRIVILKWNANKMAKAITKRAGDRPTRIPNQDLFDMWVR